VQLVEEDINFPHLSEDTQSIPLLLHVFVDLGCPALQLDSQLEVVVYKYCHFLAVFLE